MSDFYSALQHILNVRFPLQFIFLISPFALIVIQIKDLITLYYFFFTKRVFKMISQQEGSILTRAFLCEVCINEFSSDDFHPESKNMYDDNKQP